MSSTRSPGCSPVSGTRDRMRPGCPALKRISWFDVVTATAISLRVGPSATGGALAHAASSAAVSERAAGRMVWCERGEVRRMGGDPGTEANGRGERAGVGAANGGGSKSAGNRPDVPAATRRGSAKIHG